MRIGRTIPPAAAPLSIVDILHGFTAILHRRRALQRFENGLKEYFNVQHCFLVSSGKAALTLILQSLHELNPDRDEIVIPAFDCYSVPSAIVRAGLKVRLCDINPQTLDFESESLKRTLSNKSKILCILPTHFFGLSANVTILRQELSGSGIMIVEDAAQAMGGVSDDAFLGKQGDAGFFSLSRGKALSTVEGGIIITDNPRLASILRVRVAALAPYGIIQQLRLLLSACTLWFFLRPSLFWFPKLLPFVKFGETVFDPDFEMRGMSGIQAGMAHSWQNKLKEFIQDRKKISQAWTASLVKEDRVHPINPSAMEAASLIRYPVFIEDRELRDKILYFSNRFGWGITRMYPNPVDAIESLYLIEEDKMNPGAHACAENLLTLPNHGFVNDKDISAMENHLTE
jgi:perosamine synthetase